MVSTSNIIYKAPYSVIKTCIFSLTPENTSVAIGVYDVLTMDNGTATAYDVAKIKVHPGFVAEPVMLNDLSLIKLQKEIKFGSLVRPICLPNKGKYNFELN